MARSTKRGARKAMPGSEVIEHRTTPTSTGFLVPSVDQLATELTALEHHFPPPEAAEIAADCRWFQDQQTNGGLAAYRGMNVAVYQKAIVGTGANSLQLTLDLALALKLHPQRLVVEYIPRLGEFLSESLSRA